jgi:hypothetical protein
MVRGRVVGSWPLLLVDGITLRLGLIGVAIMGGLAIA